MSIFVVCPGCHKRFSVSDKFAGRSGPCPKCKTILQIPAAGEEVQVHGPEDFADGGRGRDGKLVTKPIARFKPQINPVVISAIAGSILLVVAITWVLGRSEMFVDNLLMQTLGLLIVTPPLVVAGYSLLRNNDDLAPFEGKDLLIRTAICSATYIVMWGIYDWRVVEVVTGEFFVWFLVAPPFFLVGGLAALASLDFDLGTGVLHYSAYLVITVLLRALAGLGWVWEIAEEAAPQLLR